MDLTEEKRIRALLTIAKKTKEPTQYIFRVVGMANIHEQKIANTLFYSPQHTRLMHLDTVQDPKIELELLGNKDNVRSINAAVTIMSISPESGEMIARSEIEKSFALCRRIMKGKSRLWLTKRYLTLDLNGKIKRFNIIKHQNNDEDPANFFSLDKKEQSSFEDKLSKIEKTKNVAETDGWGRKFNESCYWLKRAEESEMYVDKLLSYWICIETLCAKSEDYATNWFTTKNDQKETDIFLIKEVVGKLYAVGKCFEHVQMIYHYLLNDLESPVFLRNKDINIPSFLVKKAQLDAQEGQTISLRNIIDCSDEIRDCLPEGLLKDQLDELHNFYTDKNTALSILKKHLQNTQDELAFIYRMRNKIAHDGSSEHPLLPSLCGIAEEYANVLFNHVVRRIAEKEKVPELNSILIEAVQDYDLIEMRLQTEEPKNVLLKKGLF